jgi:hypothetical protein
VRSSGDVNLARDVKTCTDGTVTTGAWYEVSNTCNNACQKDGKKSVIYLQDLTGSYWDDIANLKAEFPLILDSEILKKSEFAVGRFADFDRFVPNPFVLDTGFLSVASQSWDINNVVQRWAVNMMGDGGDEPEAQLFAIKSAIQNLGDSARYPIVVILSTDATFHEGGAYPTQREVADILASRNASLLVLQAVTIPIPNFYQSFIDNNGINGVVVPLNADSSGVVSSLITGMRNLCR